MAYPNSSTVSAGDTATATQYNNVRLDGLHKYFGDGSDGALNVAAGTTTLDFSSSEILLKYYTSFNVSNGATLAFQNPANKGSMVIIFVQGNVTIEGKIDLDSMGALGGTGVTKTKAGDAIDSSNGNAGQSPFTDASLGAAGGEEAKLYLLVLMPRDVGAQGAETT